MTLEEVKSCVEEIENEKGDDEEAHCEEDRLYENFIKHVASAGNDELKEMAVEILKTKDISFSRWYA